MTRAGAVSVRQGSELGVQEVAADEHHQDHGESDRNAQQIMKMQGRTLPGLDSLSRRLSSVYRGSANLEREE